MDRYAQGLSAEEILNACDENVVSSADRMTNPAIHFFRGLRHRNLAAIRHAAQRGLHQLHQPQHHPSPQSDGTEIQRSRAEPLIIQGLRTNPKDQDSHVLFFDIEALVGKVKLIVIFLCHLLHTCVYQNNKIHHVTYSPFACTIIWFFNFILHFE